MGLVQAEGGQQLYGHELTETERLFVDPQTGERMVIDASWLPSAEAAETPADATVEISQPATELPVEELIRLGHGPVEQQRAA